jgi:hypothetical protein
MPFPQTAAADEVTALLARWRSFCFPGGENAAREIRAVRTTQRGEFRGSPEARWIPFTAEEVVETARSSFCWNARIGAAKLGAITVTDAYEEGHGRLVVKLANMVPLQKITGPEADRGELQRYLGEIVLCPPILLNHASLEWTAIGPDTLRVRDRQDATGATVDIEISEAGCPVGFKAERGRLVGKQTILTPWSGTGSDFQEREGMQVPARFEACWHLPEGPFPYIRGEITSFVAQR